MLQLDWFAWGIWLVHLVGPGFDRFHPLAVSIIETSMDSNIGLGAHAVETYELR